MSFEAKFFDEAKSSAIEHHENVERRGSIADEATELSGIEATAASKAAWLISITVSIGGFLFGAPQVAWTGDLYLTDSRV